MNNAYRNWKLEVDKDKILWLSIDRYESAVNSLNRDVVAELDSIIDDVKASKDIKGIIIKSAKSSGFIAGADIEQFTRLKSAEEAMDLIRQAQVVFDKLERLPIPTVAMIEGFCLGGGLELVLACKYRVAEEGPKTLIGAPEVKLGIHPGFGGTVRLPRLIGALAAMELNLSGKPVNAKTAAKLGIVDAAVPKRQLARAARFYAIHDPGAHKPAWWQSLVKHKLLRPLVGTFLTHKLKQKISADHYPAPFAIVNNWVRDGAEGDIAMLNEARSIADLLVSDSSRNLVRVFFLQTALKGLGRSVKFKPKHVHVIGAGVMGGDIAAWCALRGMKVTLQDKASELIAPAIKRAHDLFQRKLKNPRLVQAAMDRFIPDVEGLGLAEADVVIEAVSENLELKQKIFKMIDSKARNDAILATNTSSIPLDEISVVLKKPERLIGLHFFNPVALMQLVEVVRSEKTDLTVFEQGIAFVRAIDRLPLPVMSLPGFLVNRILMPYLMEAMLMLDEGIPAAVIDEAAVKFGMPMGPVELADTVGLDICLSVAQILSHYYGGKIPEQLQKMVERGELGRKSGKGFYAWQKGKPIRATSITLDEPRYKELSDRLILRMVNEAVAALREQVVADADLLDAGMVFGTGFAPFRGGVIQYAKQRGLNEVKQRLLDLTDKYGERFTPDAGWSALIANQSSVKGNGADVSNASEVKTKTKIKSITNIDEQQPNAE